MDESDDRLRRAFEALRADRGACPDADALARYAAEELPEAERRAVEDHVSACGCCELLLQRVSAFDRPDVREARPRRWLA